MPDLQPAWTVEDLQALKAMNPTDQAAFKRVLMDRLTNALRA